MPGSRNAALDPLFSARPMDTRDPASPPRLKLSLRVDSRSIVPGAELTGALELRAEGATARVRAVRVAPTLLRRSTGRDGAITEERVSLGAGYTHGPCLVNLDAARSFPFALRWPTALASSVPNQLDYDVLATVTTDEGVREEALRCLVLPASAGSLPTMPVGPAWAEVGALCEAEGDDGAWRPAKISRVQGHKALVAWQDGATASWVQIHQLREP